MSLVNNQMSENKISEKPAAAVNGFVGFIAALGLIILGFSMMTPLSHTLLGIVCVLLGFLLLSGLTVVQPQEAKIVQFMGSYLGSLREPGFYMTVPLSFRSNLSLQLRNFESPRLKVNEAEGNPIEIAVIVVWKVVDSAQAKFNVQSLEAFVEKQTESALRMMATKYPYDKHNHHPISLHENLDVVNDQLCKMVAASLENVGVEILEARISHLAYAPEIAAAMLQRQQAQAIISARKQIVEGAVGMVDMALKRLQKDGIITLDEERKAAMVSNLLVVLCSERPSQPVLNTGTIY